MAAVGVRDVFAGVQGLVQPVLGDHPVLEGDLFALPGLGGRRSRRHGLSAVRTTAGTAGAGSAALILRKASRRCTPSLDSGEVCALDASQFFTASALATPAMRSATASTITRPATFCGCVRV